MNNAILMRDDVDLLVAAERTRQHAKWGEQNHPDGTGHALFKISAREFRQSCDDAVKRNKPVWSLILLEEVYEALAEMDPDKIELELIQVMAVCKQWIEAMHRRKNR